MESALLIQPGLSFASSALVAGNVYQELCRNFPETFIESISPTNLEGYSHRVLDAFSHLKLNEYSIHEGSEKLVRKIFLRRMPPEFT